MLNKNILTDDIRQGMILGADAKDRKGEIIVSKGTILSLRHQSKLKTYGIKAVNVSIPDHLATKEELAESGTPENPLKSTEEYKNFRRSILAIANMLSECFDVIIAEPSKKVEYEEIIACINDLVKMSGSSLHLLELLQCSRDFDDSIFAHSVSVTLISEIIGKNAQFNDRQIHDLQLSALFHDIGKLGVPDEILYKTDALTDEEKETVKSHARLGYEFLSKTSLPDFVATSALYHHEHYDGSGYPEGVAGKDIPFYARYVAVADDYNAMTSKRPYREEICPFHVIKGFEDDGFQRYDAAALLPFLSSLAQSYIGSTVVLSNGQTGKIVMLNEKLSRPIVMVGKTFVDLMKKPDVQVSRIL